MCCLPLLDTIRLASIYVTSFIVLTVTGYQALLPILYNEGIFSSLCTDNKSSCSAQTLRLDLMFDITISGFNMMYLFWGFLVLKYGYKPGIIIGGTLLTCGTFIFSFGWDWPCFFGYIAMGLGRGGVVGGFFIVCAEYPKIQGLLFSLLIGCFDASCGVYYIFLLLIDKMNPLM